MTIRDPLPDILKGLAIIFMIQVHIMELFALEDIYISWAGRISLFLGATPAAPVFMMVMGYFMGISRKSVKHLLLRGIKLIGLGLLLNIGLNMHLLYRIMAGDFDLNPWQYIFGVDILFLAGLSILFIALMSKFLKKSIIPTLILILGITLLSKLIGNHTTDHEILQYFQAFFWGNYSWSYFPLIPWLAYPLTGFLIALHAVKVKEYNIHMSHRLIILFFTMVIMVFTLQWALSITREISLYYHHGTLFYIWAIVFLVFWVIINDLLIRKFNHTVIVKYFRWTGKHVTIFYVIQWLLIGNIATAIYKTQSEYQIIFWFVGILFTSSLLVWLWEKWHNQRRNQVRF